MGNGERKEILGDDAQHKSDNRPDDPQPDPRDIEEARWIDVLTWRTQLS
jgi:hypothetical protein